MKKHLFNSIQAQSSKTSCFWCCTSYFFVLALLGFIPLSNAQTKLWDKTIGGNNADFLEFVVQTSDGGYLMGGSSNSDISSDKSQANFKDVYGNNTRDYWVVKVKADGTKAWDKTYGGNGLDELTSLQQTSDGGYLLGGTSSSGQSGNKSQNSKGSSDYWVVKLKADGSKEWDKTYGGNLEDNMSALVQVTDGGYILAGTSYSGSSGDKSGNNKGIYDYWVIKINATGTKIWDKTIGGTSKDNLKSVQPTPDGGYILGGFSNSFIGGDKTENNKGRYDIEANDYTTDYWIVKLNSNGLKIWDKTIGGKDDDVLVTAQPTTDGGYILAGNSDSNSGFDKSEDNKGKFLETDEPTNDYWIVKLKADGTVSWEKTLGGDREDELTALQQTQDGGYILGGLSRSGQTGNKSDLNKELCEGSGYEYCTSDYWIVKLQGNGTKAWDKSYGSSDHDYLTSLEQNNDGSFMLAGYTDANINGDKTENSRGSLDYWLVKIKDNSLSWNFRYGGSDNEGLLTILKTADGGYLSGGYSGSGVSGDKTQNSRGKNDYWLVKSEKNGKKAWDKRFGGSEDEFANQVIATNDGGYLLAGSSLSGAGGDKSQGSRGDRDYWLVKLSSTGVKQWDKRFGGSGFDELKKVVQLATGEYILAGYSNSPAGGDKSQGSRGGHDFWLLKISSTGTKVWDKRFGGSLDETLSDMVPTTNGGFLLSGSSLSGKNGDKSQVSRGGSDFWVIRVDKNGTKLWDKTFGGTGQDEAYSLVSSGTDFLISGQSNSSAGAEKTQNSQGGTDYWLLKLNSTGTKIWDKRYGGNQDDELRASIATNDGGYLLAGRSYSGISGNKTQTSQGSSDYWIVKTDKDGKYQWDQRFGGSSYEELRAVTQASDGAYILAGRSASGVSGDKMQPSQGGSDFWLVKAAPAIMPIPSITAASETTTAAEPKEPASTVSIKAYPNPFQEKITVAFTLPVTKVISVRVLDNQGRSITTLFQGEAKANQTYQMEWQAGKQEAGLYLLQMQTPTGQNTQRILLNK